MEKAVFSKEQTSICPTEGGSPSSWSGTQKEDCVSQNKLQPDKVQIMYCKEQVLNGDQEFSFEELRAQRYYQKLNEKVMNLHKVKEKLQLQIEQKQELIKGRSNTIQQLDAPQCSHQPAEVSSASVPSEAAPLKIYCEPEISRSYNMRNSIMNHEDMGQGTTDVKQRCSQALKPFSTYGETVFPGKHIEKPNTRSSAVNHKSLKLPTPILKSRQPASVCSIEKDASLSRSEEAIVNAHWNKTLCRSPDDTCDFVRAAQLASTPFGGPGRQNPLESEQMEEHESLNKTGPVIFKEPTSESRAVTNKLSPIQEISHEWGYNSLASTHLLQSESQKKATAQSGIPEVIQPTTEQTVCAPTLGEIETVNPCSLDVRKALLDNVDLGSISNFSKKVGPLPDPDDLQLDDQTLFFLKKMGDQGTCLYFSNGGCVLVKMDESTVPWDFYINSQLRARLPADQQHCHAQSTCYLYENGSFTLLQVPQGQTIQELLEDHVDRRHVPLLAIRLLEMVKQMHSCQLVHGALQPETLIVCHSCKDRVICMDFSNSLDLELQTDVKTVQYLPSAQDYIKQGLLLPSASPYQLDLCGIAEIVHLLLFGKNMKIIKETSYWTLADDCGPLDWQRALDPSNLSDPLWQDLFHKLLNPEDNSTEFILTNLINNLKNTFFEDLECPISL